MVTCQGRLSRLDSIMRNAEGAAASTDSHAAGLSERRGWAGERGSKSRVPEQARAQSEKWTWATLRSSGLNSAARIVISQSFYFQSANSRRTSTNWPRW